MLASFVKNLAFRSAWLLIAFFCFLLFFTTSLYFSFRTDLNFLLAKQSLIHDLAWMSAFYIHISGSMTAVLTGPWQFIPALRRKYPRFHRISGQLYVFAILTVGGPSGFYMAFFANGGIGAMSGFFILSLLWLFTTFKAYQLILRRDIPGHRKWMVRSFALTFSAVTLRLWVPILSLFTPLDGETVVVATAWINWIPNLLIGEALNAYFSKRL